MTPSHSPVGSVPVASRSCTPDHTRINDRYVCIDCRCDARLLAARSVHPPRRHRRSWPMCNALGVLRFADQMSPLHTRRKPKRETVELLYILHTASVPFYCQTRSDQELRAESTGNCTANKRPNSILDPNSRKVHLTPPDSKSPSQLCWPDQLEISAGED